MNQHDTVQSHIIQGDNYLLIDYIATNYKILCEEKNLLTY